MKGNSFIHTAFSSLWRSIKPHKRLADSDDPCLVAKAAFSEMYPDREIYGTKLLEQDSESCLVIIRFSPTFPPGWQCWEVTRWDSRAFPRPGYRMPE